MKSVAPGHWCNRHLSRTRYYRSINNFRRILRVGSGTEINPCRGENIGRSTIFITGERYANNAAISSSFLRKIRDLKKVIVGHHDYQSRTRAGDNFGLERIGKRKACCSQDNERNRTSGGEDLHA